MYIVADIIIIMIIIVFVVIALNWSNDLGRLPFQTVAFLINLSSSLSHHNNVPLALILCSGIYRLPDIYQSKKNKNRR